MKRIGLFIAVGIVFLGSAGVSDAAAKKKKKPPDKTPPVAKILTPVRTVFRPSGPGPLETRTRLHGSVTDNDSGVKSVTVYYRPCQEYSAPDCTGYVPHGDNWEDTVKKEYTPITATLKCNSTKRSCTWEADPPELPGGYFAWVFSIDAAKNRQPPNDHQVIWKASYK